jgi:GxxExxY protein
LEPELERLSSEVIGAAIEVHRALGPGLMESTYEQAVCVELALRNISYLCQHVFAVEYKGQRVGEGRVDLIVDHRLIVELKAVESLAPVHTAQLIAYLRATRNRLGLLINFNVAVLKDGIKRVVV